MHRGARRLVRGLVQTLSDSCAWRRPAFVIGTSYNSGLPVRTERPDLRALSGHEAGSYRKRGTLCRTTGAGDPAMDNGIAAWRSRLGADIAAAMGLALRRQSGVSRHLRNSCQHIAPRT